MDINEAYEAWLNAAGDDRERPYVRLYAAVRRYLLRLMWIWGETSSEVADEAVEDVMLHLGSFQNRAKFSTWVYWIAINHRNDHWRERAEFRKRFVPLPEEDPSEDDGMVLDEYCYTDDILNRIYIGELQRLLADGDRPLVEGIMEGKSRSELSEELQTTVDAIYGRVWRFRRRMKRQKIFS
jgi:DNA-directed RNA polymerase specialized sigma24 family protein